MKRRLHTVLTTPEFHANAERAGVTQEELNEFITWLAQNPQGGVVVPGAGGARKVRFRAKGRGKSGSYRTYHYFGGDDLPVFLLNVFAKSKQSDLSAKAKAVLADRLPQIAKAYRASVKTRVVQMRKPR